jgi:hypothetical protein
MGQLLAPSLCAVAELDRKCSFIGIVAAVTKEA